MVGGVARSGVGGQIIRMDELGRGATTRSFEEKYERLRSDGAACLRRLTLGSSVPNGYTTVGQAERLAGALKLEDGDCLLDLGAGRGWPGSAIAERTGCSLITTDLPLRALRTGRERMKREGREATPVCADGRCLPFRDSAFDGVCHTDVLC